MFACRACGTSDVRSILSLGKTPLANALLTLGQLNQSEEVFPLELVFCPHCTLVQITETVSPEKLFREYLYFSSFSETVLENAHILAGRIIERCGLNDQSLVLEVASNDGYLLQNYKQRGIPVLGVEPARNISVVAEEKGIPTVSEFFNVGLAEQLKDKGDVADVIHANNVIAHVADLQGVVEGISILLKPDGVAIIENHYVKDMIVSNLIQSIMNIYAIILLHLFATFLHDMAWFWLMRSGFLYMAVHCVFISSVQMVHDHWRKRVLCA